MVASVLVAASIALYENPQVRQWVDQSRRKLAVALHSLGDEINPASRSRSSDDDDTLAEEQRRRRREEIVRRNRLELIRRAREQGVAVDLDELAAVGREYTDEKKTPQSARGQSFDDMIGDDGRLRSEQSAGSTAASTAVEQSEKGLRQRGQAAHGIAAGATFANPFTDEAHVIFDQDEDEKKAMESYAASRESTATLQEDAQVLIPQEDSQQSAPPLQVPQLLIPVDQATEASFYSAAGEFELADIDDVRSNGTLTPTEGGFSTSVSVAGSNGDIGILSETMSEAGFSETAFSEVGVSTPGSWTDVGSDAGSDDGFGHVSQQH